MKRRATLTVAMLFCALLSGCYREVVSAKGLGAAAYDNEIRGATNYSGLPFDAEASREIRKINVPGAGTPRGAN